MHVLLGNLTQESFRPEEFGAYYRRVCRRLEEFVADPPETEPYPCEQCGICEFKPLCDKRWDAVDHLSRVAGIQRRQIDKLDAFGITTLAAGRRAANRPCRIATDTFEAPQQADSSSAPFGHDYALLQPRGLWLALLPAPSAGISSSTSKATVLGCKGASRTWGILDTDGNFDPMFASTREEGAHVERFVDLVHERLSADPAMRLPLRVVRDHGAHG
jgi:uncharacterized protein